MEFHTGDTDIRCKALRGCVDRGIPMYVMAQVLPCSHQPPTNATLCIVAKQARHVAHQCLSWECHLQVNPREVLTLAVFSYLFRIL